MKKSRRKKSSSGKHVSWADEEAHSSGHPPPSPAPGSTTRRTSGILPPLVQPTAGAAVPKKQAQPVALPELVQRPLEQPAGRRPDRAPGRAAQQQASLPRESGRERTRTGAAAPVSGEPDTPLPLYPELADEHFLFLWEKKRQRGKTLKETLEMMDEREVLTTVLMGIYKSLQYPSAVGQEAAGPQSSTSFLDKIRLYKYYGLKLRDARRREVIADHLRMFLCLSLRPEAHREGIGEALGVAAFCHLGAIVEALRDFSRRLRARRAVPGAASQEERDRAEREMHATAMLCFGQAASGARPDDLLQMAERMVREVLFHFRAQSKDAEMKRTFMRAIVTIARAIARSGREDAEFPRKSETGACISGILEEEPLGSLSVDTLHQALVTISSLTCLKPPLEPEVRSALVGAAIRKVLSLPFFRVARGNAGSPTFQTQEYFHRTISACQQMLSNVLLESPSLDALQEILTCTRDWVESPKSHERERALRITSHLLQRVSEQENFDFTPDFHLLGQLVAALALHIADGVTEVGEAAAEALSHLHRVTSTKIAKDRERRRRNRGGRR